MTATAEPRGGIDLDGLRAAMPDGGLREAGAEDAVQGVAPTAVAEPASEAEVAALLRAASRQGLAVVARGGGTKLAWGGPPRRLDVVLSTARLGRLIDHAPGDLVCIAGAGVRLADLGARLAGHRQRLALDPPQGEAATIGGVLATAASGSLRGRFGGVRDLCIGTRFVLGDGTVGHSGGRVVKNVAGYDMGRLLAGSLGTLAVVTQAAFRLHPLPETARTVVVDGASPSRLQAVADRVATLPVAATVDLYWPDGLAAIRVESTRAAAEDQSRQIATAVAGRLLDPVAAEALEATLKGRPWEGIGAVAGIGVPASRVGALLELCSDLAEECVVRARAGVAEALLREDAEVVVTLRGEVERLGGHLSLRRAGPDLAGMAWSAAPREAVELMRSVKARLDPGGVLAPGRFLGGI